MRILKPRAVFGVAVLVISGLVLAQCSVALGVHDLLSVPAELFEAVRVGSLDRLVILRTVVVILWMCWLVGVLSTTIAVLSCGHREGPLRRWVFIGVLVLGIGSATPVAAEPTPQITDREPRTDETEESDHSLVTAPTVGSSLVAAGLGWIASRWWLDRRRRGTLQVDSSEGESLLASIRRYDIELVASASNSVRAIPSSTPVFLRTHDGRFLAVTDGPTAVQDQWRTVNSQLMELDESDVGKSDDAGDCLIVHVGNTEVGEVWCDLERARSLHVDPSRPESENIVRAISASLATSPIAPTVALLTDRDPIGPRASAEFDDSTVHSLCVTNPVVRVGNVVDSSVTASVVRNEPIDDQVGVRWTGVNWELTPVGVPIVPVALDRQEAESLSECVETFTESEWQSTSGRRISKNGRRGGFLVTVLGPPEVIDPSGRRVQFERSKSRELVVWLALHPEIQRRSLARDAMWPVAIKDATFSNITADVRRSMTLASAPPAGEQWLGITLNDDLPLHDQVECDLSILRGAVSDTRAEPEVHGARLLRDALELVRGMPFAGTSYGWPDAIGIETEVALLVVRAATMLAEMYEEEDDLEGAYWASARGLVAVPGHEDLVTQRMRLHSRRGDSNALRREWDAYQRTLVLDDGRMLEASAKVRDFAREF